MLKITAALAGLVSIAAMAAAPVPPAPGAAPAALPSGPGLVLINERCSGCHTPATVFGQRRTPEDWAATVQTMVDRGADLSPDDMDLVITYLSQNLGPQPATR